MAAEQITCETAMPMPTPEDCTWQYDWCFECGGDYRGDPHGKGDIDDRFWPYCSAQCEHRAEMRAVAECGE